jgi:nucleotide-binding universal stress UspA family protein
MAEVKVKKIMFPVDFTESSHKVAKHVKFYAQALGAELTLIHTIRGPEDFSGFEMGAAWWSSYEGELLKGAQKAMDSFMEEEFGGMKGVKNVVLIGDIVEEIVKYAQKNNIDLIIVGTHGRKGLEKVVFGSVAEGIVKKAHCPVLSINPYKIS